MFRLFENINQQYCAGRVTVSQGVFLMKLSHKKDAEGNVKIEIEASEGLNVIQ